MKAYHMDDETIYAADSAEDATREYFNDFGETPEDDYPQELTDSELDRPQDERDEDERPTGKKTSIREWLGRQIESGFLCGSL